MLGTSKSSYSVLIREVYIYMYMYIIMTVRYRAITPVPMALQDGEYNNVGTSTAKAC